jgi:3-hydroxyisobutyrate dehydrogenase
MAGHLAGAGHRVRVWNRTRERAERWCAVHRGEPAADPAGAVDGASFVFACTGNDDALREICEGPGGALPAMADGAVFVDHTTVSAAITRTLAESASARGVAFLDAPVSGGEEGAKRGALTVMVGGDASAFTRAAPMIGHYAKTVKRLGPSGAGQLTKMVNQLCVAGVLQGLSEGLHFAQRAGLDPRAVVEVISQGAAGSWQMQNRAETMIEGRFDFGFAVDWMRKDLGIALEEASRNGAELPVAAIVDRFYHALQRRGHGRSDTSSLIELLRAAPEDGS